METRDPVDLVVVLSPTSNVASVEPRTDSGREWLRSLPVESWQRLGAAVGVDIRCLEQLVDDATADGLTIDRP